MHDLHCFYILVMVIDGRPKPTISFLLGQLIEVNAFAQGALW